MHQGPCRHPHRQMMRVVCVNGAVQVRELCLDCGVNVRGPGVCVPHAEVYDRNALPLLEDRRPRHDGQRHLFDFAED